MLLLRVTKVNEGFLYLVCLAVVSLAVFLFTLFPPLFPLFSFSWLTISVSQLFHSLDSFRDFSLSSVCV